LNDCVFSFAKRLSSLQSGRDRQENSDLSAKAEIGGVEVSVAPGGIDVLTLLLTSTGNIFSIPDFRLKEGLSWRRGIMTPFRITFSLALLVFLKS
jgi:hypothetical protein